MNAITLKNIVKNTILLFIILSISSCNLNSNDYKEEFAVENVDLTHKYQSVEADKKKVAEESSGMTTIKTSHVPATNIPADLKIIKTANTRYKVKNIESALYDIKQLMYAQGGYISELRFDNDAYKKQNRFTIKVPKENFDAMLDGIQKFAEVTDFVNISTTDVTEQYVDVKTRLKTKLEVKKRLEAILRKKAIKVEDILATEENLRVIQEEIEAAQGKMLYMTNRVAFSTIQVEIYETVTYKEEPIAYEKGFFAKAKDGLTSGWEMIENIFLGLLHIWPFLILGTIGVIFLRRWLKNKKQH